MPWLETISACLPKPFGESRTIFHWNKVLVKQKEMGKRWNLCKNVTYFPYFVFLYHLGGGGIYLFLLHPLFFYCFIICLDCDFLCPFFWISERSFCVRYCIHSNRFFINQHNFSCTTIHNQKSYSTENNNIITLSYHVLISKWLHTISYFVQHSFVILF